jgi:hypothetical protein
MERLGGKCLAELFEAGFLRSGYQKGPWATLGHEGLAVDYDSSEPIAKVAKGVIGRSEMLSLIRDNEADDILGDEHGGELATLL